MSKKVTFDEVKDPRRLNAHCPVCGDEIPTGTVRGKLQLVLSSLEYIPSKEGKGRNSQKVATVASLNRIMCESCSVILFREIEDYLPAKRSAGRTYPRNDTNYGGYKHNRED